VSIERIGAKALRSKSFVRTVTKSDPMYAKCVVTGMSFGRTVAICAVIVVTFAETGAMRAGTKNTG
jgi:hypothetical protein